jgi:polyribonucleotide nucleotidyltransferase
MKKIEKSIEFAGRKLTLSTGHVAEQATSAVMASYGDTVVLATIVAQDLKEDWGYFPLQVEYQQRLYAGGRIKGSRWVKREGKPSDDDVLIARLVDRSIRPLFPKNYNKEIQVVITVLSVDLENSPDFVAGCAVSAAFNASSIPWGGPISMIKVGLKDEKLITNPKEEEIKEGEMELFVSSTDKAVIMIEAGAKQVSEEIVLKGMDHAQKAGKKILKFITDFSKSVGNKKDLVEDEKFDKGVEMKVRKLAKESVLKLATGMADKTLGYSDYDETKKAISEEFEDEDKKQAVEIFEKLFSENIRNMILSGRRPDGRKHDELRDLSSSVSVLPRTHGSAIFNRGQTQALSIATIGASSLELLIETAEGEESKRYIHHYSMPPYSTGETGRYGFPKRREIGHGALAEKALFPVIPTVEEFPYTIRVVTETLSSNGSTSMASACGSTLSLMDAGVPIVSPVAGIAMGLIIDSPNKYKVLTDIVGVEDGNGDMDFKVAGTKNGITALQLDVKTQSLTLPILKDALEQAKKARNEILKVMLKAIGRPREEVSKYAPKIKTIKIDREKIGEVIGPSGRTIKGLTADTGAEIDVSDDGTVSVSAITEESVKRAIEKIEGLVAEVEVGQTYEGEVKRVENYGAFVEVLPGKDGLVHVSEMSQDFVKDPNEVVKIGQKVKVKVREIDNFGRVNLTMLLDGQKSAKPVRQNDRSRGYKDRRGGYSDRRRDTRGRRDYRRGDSRSDQRRRSSGPHFPTSRFLEEAQNLGRKRN